jgi:hypothetical protein
MANTKKSRKKSGSNRVVNPKKNVRSQRGIPETNYGEIKKISSFSLTPTAISLLKSISQELNISTSELLERFARSGAGLKDQLRQNHLSEKPANEVLEALYKP